jgi:hypothetical protein
MPLMNETTQKGIAALKSGNRTQARQLLASAVLENDHDVTAWLWLAAALEKDEDRLRCLHQVLRIDPENAAARQGIVQIEAHRAGDAHPRDPRRGEDRPGVTRPLTPPPAAPKIASTAPATPEPAASEPAAPELAAPAVVNTVSDVPAAEPIPGGHTQPVKVAAPPPGEPPHAEPPTAETPPAVVPTDLRDAAEPPTDRSPDPAGDAPAIAPATAPAAASAAVPSDEEFTLPVRAAETTSFPDILAPEIQRMETLFPHSEAAEPAILPVDFGDTLEPAGGSPAEPLDEPAAPPSAAVQTAEPVPAHSALPDSGLSANPGPLPNNLNNRRSQAGRPPAEGGKLIFRTRPSLVPALICFWVFLIGAIGIAWLLYDAPELGLPIAGGLGLMLELIVLYVILRNLTAQYELTTRALTLRQRGKRVRIAASDIYGAELRQTPFQRLLGTGAILVDASVHGELAHFTLRDVPDCRLRLLQIRAQAGIPSGAPGHSVSAML